MDILKAYHRRRSIRLPEFDYSQAGAYFITICTHGHELLFGEIQDGEIHLNSMGKIVHKEWLRTNTIRENIRFFEDEFVVMPNHIHGIIHILENGMIPSAGAYGHTPLQMPRSPSKTIGAIVRGFKSAVTTQINTLRSTPGVPVWQRNYYEHVIRDEADLARIAEYIHANPLRWKEDEDIKNKQGQVF